jgi:hypothetical protein
MSIKWSCMKYFKDYMECGNKIQSPRISGDHCGDMAAVVTGWRKEHKAFFLFFHPL